ncbi:hypothetical protein GALMADRAFT_1244347 [Galerina marginata CBS 339.88]|uniref:Uncharacterized protein n=1 Tax=Galerina marginata (strain CBS 339.88) TaxID=685588 RepID=A0A067T8U6_GALM3|nr:hypothetical protein GALMADRAFT_1244347 [Galerina marginata CBS 339.88]
MVGNVKFPSHSPSQQRISCHDPEKRMFLLETMVLVSFLVLAPSWPPRRRGGDRLVRYRQRHAGNSKIKHGPVRGWGLPGVSSSGHRRPEGNEKIETTKKEYDSIGTQTRATYQGQSSTKGYEVLEDYAHSHPPKRPGPQATLVVVRSPPRMPA